MINHGSTFSLTIPEHITNTVGRSENEASSVHALKEEKKPIANKLEGVKKAPRVLIVDDDERNIFALSRVLESFGYDFTTVSNGVEALEALKRDTSFAIVLMDTMMPVMDGLETTKRIRSELNLHDLPIIALTGRAMKGDREDCLAAGCNDYLSKPIDIDQLLSLIESLISKQSN